MYVRVRYVDAQGLEWREKVRVRSKEKVGVERAVAPRCPAQHRRVGHLPPRRAHVHGGSERRAAARDRTRTPVTRCEGEVQTP